MKTYYFKLRHLPIYVHSFFWSLKCCMSKNVKKFRFYSTYKLTRKLIMVLCARKETWNTSVRNEWFYHVHHSVKQSFLSIPCSVSQGVPTWRYNSGFQNSWEFSFRKPQTYIRSWSRTFKKLAPEGGIIVIIFYSKQQQNSWHYPMKEHTNIFPDSLAHKHP